MPLEGAPNRAQCKTMSNSGRRGGGRLPHMVSTHPATRARLASFVSLELSGFVQQGVAEQAAARAQAQSFLRTCLAGWPQGTWRLLDLQQRLLIQLPDSPVHALCLVLGLLQAPADWLQGWKIGAHVGVSRDEPDLQGQPRPVGEGVTRALALAGQAVAGQAVASRAFVDAVRDLHGEYASLFESSAEDTVLLGDRWRVRASASVLEQLRLELAAQRAPDAAADETALGLGQARELISRWFMPINALMFSIVLLLGQGGRIGLTSDRLRVAGLLLAALGLIGLGARVALRHRHRAPGWLAHRGVAWVLVAYGLFLSTGAYLSAHFAGPTTEAVAAPLVAAPPPAAVPAMAPTAANAPASASVPAAAPVPVTVSAPSRSTPVARSVPSSLADTPAARPAAAPSPRCSAIVARSALGEPLSPADQHELMTSCR